MTFVDTSALLAFLDADDDWHAKAVPVLEGLIRTGEALTHNYVVVETEALTHRRLGGPAARKLLERVVPVLSMAWVDEDLHRRSVASHVAGLRRGSSLVDHVSFELMRDQEIERAFAFDRDFRREGFEVIPGR